jgi:demethoxyubiquinone hydroxylase (CLK1/Coq7/Cat5 family)
MNIDTLRKEFRKILDYENRAKFHYDHYIEQVEDPEVKATLEKIRDDEIMHIKIAEKLIEYVS